MSEFTGMRKNSKDELDEARKLVSSTISKCEKMLPKFEEGTSQHSLLKNRIKALYISKSLLEGEDISDKYSIEELREALAPVSSIISKCEKAQSKYEEGTSQFKRFENIIKAMKISKSLILDAIKVLE